MRTVTRSAPFQAMVGALAAGYLWCVRATSTRREENAQAVRTAQDGGAPVIVAFWHNRLLKMAWCWPKGSAPFDMLISSHADGRLIARTVAHFGIGAVAGSSRRGGAEAMRGLLRAIRAGHSVGITPDGPRGPRYQANDGAVALARLSGAVIVPAAAATSRRKVIGSWDRLLVPLPFSRLAIVWGDPITVARDADAAELAAVRRALEDGLNDASRRADLLAGAPPEAGGEEDSEEGRHGAA